MSASKTGSSVDKHITKSQFWNVLMHDVYGPRQGGAIIFIDAENARKGVAKTSCAVALARLFSRAFRYELQEEDFTLAGSHYLKRYQEHPGKEQPSVLVLDEFVGAGTGDSRRATSHSNVDMGRAWQLLRAKRVVTLTTLPDWNESDPRLQKYADYRVWCREKPIGFFQPYKVTVPFNSAGSGARVRTKGLSYGDSTDRIAFPNMDSHNDHFYKHLTRKKDELIHSSTWNANTLDGDEEEEEEQLTADEIERRELTKIAIRLYEPWDDDNDNSYEDVANALGNRTHAWVGQRVREWKDGKHRDLVDSPKESDDA